MAIVSFPHLCAHSKRILHLCHQVPSTYETILSDHPQQSMVLTKCGHPRACLAQKLHASGDVVDSSTSQTHATSNSTLLHALMGKCKHSWGWTGHYQNNRRELRKCAIADSNTIQRQIWANDILSCGFGLQRSLLTGKWKSGRDKVGFCWGAVTGTFMSISAHWKHKNSIDFFASNGPVATFLSKGVLYKQRDVRNNQQITLRQHRITLLDVTYLARWITIP